MTSVEKLEKILASWSTDPSDRNTILDVAEILPRAQKNWPQVTAYICNDDHITYHQLYCASTHFAHLLSQNGVRAGDRVIIYYPNSIDFFIAYFAIWHLGAVVSPVNIFATIPEFLKIAHDATPNVVIIADKKQETLTAEQLQELPCILSNQDIQSCREYQYPHDIALIKRNRHELAALLYTSGTTGTPKGVMLSSYNILYNTAQALAAITVDFQTKTFCPLPLFHSLPQNICVWATSLVGGTAITVSQIDRKSILQALELKPNIIIAVPALYGLFCLLKNLNFDAVTYFASGADALPQKIKMGFELLYRRKIMNGYGMTEASPFISVELDDALVPPTSCGYPLPGTQVSIRNEQNQEASAEEIGTLWLKGDNIMLGYYNAPEATQAVLQDGWLNTGDLARLIGGKIEICGRQKDLIINKGAKIYPQEVEHVILQHPAVTAVAVVGSHIGEEEVPVAFIASATLESAQLEQDLKDWCKERLTIYKVPRTFIIRTELPMTATGKINKKKLKEEL